MQNVWLTNSSLKRLTEVYPSSIQVGFIQQINSTDNIKLVLTQFLRKSLMEVIQVFFQFMIVSKRFEGVLYAKAYYFIFVMRFKPLWWLDADSTVISRRQYGKDMTKYFLVIAASSDSLSFNFLWFICHFSVINLALS